ncbi:hypothetical protein TL16_g07088 [Triparma laevis f. inornata]|uniref:Queuosine 5'-phosphate N-glycosylase/hydrolase n=1 Tax=Triparma laevis f. inornata TaxID=1714386 RepID=A0A9W7AYX2_9STRA|nr:hypothetical protein TL16_g07088 [Triparma laevis f. inornata]
MMKPSISPSANVRRTSDNIMDSAIFVAIDQSKLIELATKIENERRNSPDGNAFTSWDEHGWHYKGEPEQTALYVLVLDALNFCFWPSEKGALQYDHLAIALKTMCEGGDFRFSPARLAAMTVEELRAELDPLLPCPMPAIEERCRLLNELGEGLTLFWEGSALKMIEAANSSADSLVHIISRSFPGFRDTCVSPAGTQCYFYKRAQIAVADLWAAFDHSHPCNFTDINKLTTFADYRVPQLLRDLDVMVYNAEVRNYEERRDELRTRCFRSLFGCASSSILDIDGTITATQF